MPPLLQDDIREYYEKTWQSSDASAEDDTGLVYSSPIEDEVLYPLYQQLLDDLKIVVNGGNILDVGSGSGRWVRYFLERFVPASLLGIDFTRGSIDLLNRRYSNGPVPCSFRIADLTQPELDLGRKFDLINVMNVLFHIPEPDRFMHAMRNLAAHLAPGGRIVTTEYLPRQTMRTNWMLVRSRYDFEAAVCAVGLRIVATMASSFFSNDPMGLEGHDTGLRDKFHNVKNGMNQILSFANNPDSKTFFVKFFGDIEKTLLAFCSERMAQHDLPSQKLVVLGT